MLLHRYKPDLEILNNVVLGDTNTTRQIFSNVSLLWVATSINDFEVVKLLVEHGANVNHRTKTNSTPLRGASYNGNVDMARYLIENGADVHLAKENNDTNLMVSVCHKHLNMVTYLVDELNYDVNECDNNGRSSLYDAVTCGSVELVEFLLKRGARNFQAVVDQMSPLMWAAERKRSELVDIISPYCSLLERIEAEELLASALICGNRDDHVLDQSFKHFCRALELRTIHNLSKATKSTTNAIFDNRHECQTIKQLEEIRSNTDQLYIEALLVRERLLGSTNGEYRYSLCYRGAILADNGQYHKAVAYWIYELSLCQQYSISIDPKHLRRFASLFSGMLYKIKFIPMEALFTIIKETIEQLEYDKKNFNDNLSTLLFLITIVSQFLVENIASTVDCKTFFSLLHSICHRHYTKLDSGMSLLHLALDTHTWVDDYHIKRICKYPCLITTRILLQCGAAVNAYDTIRNTPLHIIASSKSAYNKCVLNLLCDAGAHLDCVNAFGETPIDLATISDIKQLLKSRMKISLKCLCAQLIRKKNVPFHDKIAVSLINFVEKH
ncbi:unnamed protein product [Rotaria sordida]|uniref:Protein fem-1 homolog B n=1 Tax=Rotaria sordida TaxID=392033 RepID=A0A815LQG1_9BILA|nr:unnamed protein product [Rotaria sordida]CAF1413091.1 unnamed protein product [Rotaria sordida]